jgi:hypothetical protein
MAKKSRFRSKEGSAKDDILNRTEESVKRQGGSGKWADFLVPDFKGDKFVAKEGDHLIDIIPYLAGENDPKLKEGDRSYMVDVYVHQKVGVNEDSVICPSSNYRGKQCPICEYQAKMQQSKQFSDDDLKALKPKRRVLYNVICYDSPEQESKGVHVWEASYHLTENEILSIARNRRGGGHVPFADPDEGKSIDFYREGVGAATRYKGYKFVDREEVISDDDLDAAYCLDELLDIKSYEDIDEMFKPTAPPIPGEEHEEEDQGQEDEKQEKDYDNGRKGSKRRREVKEKDAEEGMGKIDPEDSGPEDKKEEKEEEKPASGIARRRRR